MRAQYNNTTPPVLSELLRSAAYYNANAPGDGGQAGKRGGGRSAEITRTEMEDTIRTMADAIKAKDEQMAETIRAKDEQMAATMKAKDDAMRAKDREMHDTIKTMTESMRAMQQELSALRDPSSLSLSASAASAGPSAPKIVDIAL